MIDSTGMLTASPRQPAEICVALVVGLESQAEAAHLLRPAADALVNGLLRPSEPSPTGIAGRVS